MRTIPMAHHEPMHLHLSEPARRSLLIALSVATPYLLAAVGVFIYHGQ